MLDFTSALYLGLQHPSNSLRPWRAFTTGAPAALVEPLSARAIARALADLQGCEAAILAPSTLHLAWDLFGLLAEKPITILMDAGAYSITRWGVQRAAMRGATERRPCRSRAVVPAGFPAGGADARRVGRRDW